MANIFIYSGLGILILGSLFGIYIAVRGIKESGGKFSSELQLNPFNHVNRSPVMKRLTKSWMIIMVIGFIVTGIGISIGLK
ncbi:MAG: hypothetical protein J6A20_04735 [Muribaculaceae bacterium]|nr:hypothetical protein [Muribaculaceae bacterium]